MDDITSGEWQHTVLKTSSLCLDPYLSALNAFRLFGGDVFFVSEGEHESKMKAGLKPSKRYN